LTAVGLLAIAAISHMRPESGARKTYSEFARAWAYQNLEAARTLTVEGSPARRMVDSRIDLRKRGAFPGSTLGINGLSHSVLSQFDEDGGRTITLRVQQKINLSGMGEESAMGRPSFDEQIVTLKAEGESWKVFAFEERPL
jgi:hypothetical protein